MQPVNTQIGAKSGGTSPPRPLPGARFRTCESDSGGPATQPPADQGLGDEARTCADSTQRPRIRRSGTRKRRILGVLLGLGGAATAQGQVPPGTPPRPEPGPAPVARVVEARIDAVPGRPLVVPVALEPARTPARDAPPIEVALERSGPITCELVWFAPERAAHAASDTIEAWLDRPVQWTAAESWSLPDAHGAEGPGFWALVIHLPEGCAGQTLTISGRTAPVQWLSAPAPAPDPGADEPFRTERPGLRAMLAPARRDPLNRWRTRLLMERLKAPRGSVFDRYEERMAAHALESLAEQSEWRWRIALDRLAKAEPFLAADLLNRLTAVVDFGEGRLAPAWPTDEGALAALRTELLDPRASAEDTRRSAAAFLLGVAPASAWIIDDAGWVDAESGLTMAIVGVAERAGREAAARAALGGSGPGAPVPIAPLSVRRLTAASARRASGSTAGAPTTTVEIGRLAVALETLPAGVPVRPPGLRMGPGFLAWTLDSWTEGRPRPAPAGLSIDALLHRRGDGAPGGRWQIYVECPVEPGAPPGEPAAGSRACVRILLGPTPAPIASLRLTESGALVDEVSGATLAPVFFERRADRFVAIVAIPERAIGADGLLRIGMERIDTPGGRATWPRPEMPWDAGPGRAALDLAEWKGLEGEGSAPGR